MNIGFIVPVNPKKFQTRYFYKLESDEFRRQGHKVIYIPGPYTSLEKTQKLARKLDFVICHFLGFGENATLLNIPYCAIYHGPTPKKKVLARELDNDNNCKWIGYEGQYHLNMLNDWNVKKEKRYWIPPVDTNLFKKRKDIGKRIICGSRLLPVKGIDIAIKSHNDIDVFGDGEAKYTKYLQSLSNKAVFYGRVSSEELRDIYDNGWLYLFPGIKLQNGRSDGMPSTIQEALLMELQVIASPVGAIPELKHIHLCESNSNKISKMIKEIPKERNKKGREYILDNFSPKQCVDKLIKDIEEVI